MEARPSRMEGNIHLSKTGMFQSRTVQSGKNTCSLDQFISSLGRKIKEADVNTDEVTLEKLKTLLTAVSSVEKKDRGLRSSVSHLFSKRDKNLKKLDETITAKIEKQRALKAFAREGIVILPMDDLSPPFKSLVPGLHVNGNELIDNIRVTWPMDVIIENKKVPVQFYVKVVVGDGEASYQMVLKDPVKIGNKTFSTREVVDYLQMHGVSHQ